MTERDALQALAAALPPGSAVSVPREWLLELLDGIADAPTPSAVALPPADLTCAEVGQRLGRAPSTIRNYCERGELPGAYRWRAREWRIPPAALLSLEQAERHRGNGGAAPKPSRSRGRPVNLGAWRSERSVS